MLVLNRQPGEETVIDDRIVVTVLKVLGRKVTFGIEAPVEVPSVRRELPVRRRRTAADRVVANPAARLHAARASSG